MLFNSIEFLIFFPLVAIFYFLTPNKYRWALLLGASYFFYASANGKFLFLLLFSTIVDYWAAIKMDEHSSKEKKKPFLVLSLIINLGILGLFKYYNFFIDSFEDLLGIFNLNYAIPALNLILPVGISFYTLQTLAYSIDVYKGRLKAEKHLGYFALYVCYFPQLVAGPIERANNLLPQFKNSIKLNINEVSNGLKLMGFGLFKKVVIADQIGPLIQYVTDSPNDFGGVSIFLCLALFAYQIYCDFSGYSDIAIGAAQVMGIKLMTNFRRPFVATSLSELWSRWHISLIQWFRDYIFVPFTKGKSNVKRIYLGTLIVFVTSGLWHGASSNFVIWGFINGLIIILYRVFKIKKYSVKYLRKTRKENWYTYFLRYKTFIIFIIPGAFFITTDLNSALTLLSNLTLNWPEDISKIFLNEEDNRGHILYLGSSIMEFFILILSIIILEVIQYFQERYGSVREQLNNRPIAVRWSLYIALIFSIIIFSFDKETPFIYFQF